MTDTSRRSRHADGRFATEVRTEPSGVELSEQSMSAAALVAEASRGWSDTAFDSPHYNPYPDCLREKLPALQETGAFDNELFAEEFTLPLGEAIMMGDNDAAERIASKMLRLEDQELDSLRSGWTPLGVTRDGHRSYGLGYDYRSSSEEVARAIDDDIQEAVEAGWIRGDILYEVNALRGNHIQINVLDMDEDELYFRNDYSMHETGDRSNTWEQVKLRLRLEEIAAGRNKTHVDDSTDVYDVAHHVSVSFYDEYASTLARYDRLLPDLQIRLEETRPNSEEREMVLEAMRNLEHHRFVEAPAKRRESRERWGI